MIFHENCLLADDSHEISYLILSRTRKDIQKFVVCCSCDWRFKGYAKLAGLCLTISQPGDNIHRYPCTNPFTLAGSNPYHLKDKFDPIPVFSMAE